MASAAVATISQPSLYLLGAVLVLGAAAGAWTYRRQPGGVIGFGALVELGVACAGLAGGVPAAAAGAVLLLVFQAAARLLAWGAWRRLRAGAARGSLRGAGHGRPVSGALFALGMFASLGLSPFLVPEGRLLILHGLPGGLFPALVLAAVSLGMAWLTLDLVQAVCFESPAGGAAPQADSWTRDRPGPVLAFLAVAVAGLGVLAHPAQELAAGLLGLAPGALPHLGDGWHPAALVPYAGAFVVWALAARGLSAARLLAVVLVALSLGLALADASLDPLARLFAVLVGGVGLAVAVYSCGYIRPGPRAPGYFLFLLLMLGALMGLATTRSFGSFYGFWELMTLSSYLLVIHERTAEALSAGRRYFLMSTGGALFMLPGLLLLAGGGGLDFAAVAGAAAGLAPGVLGLALVLALLGFAVKAGLVPLHSWLPVAHPVAPSSISAPLSGLLTKMGVYGIVRVFLGVCGVPVLLAAGQGTPWIGSLLTFLGLVTMAYGEIMALRQDDLKRLLAFSTIGQIGEIVLVLGLCSWLSTTAALSHVLNHAVMKNLLFLGAGALIMRAGGRRLADLSGLGRAMPWTSACMVVGALSVMGLPPFAGFASKYLMLLACVDAGRVDLAAGLLLASLAGAVYAMRIVRVLLFEPRRGAAPAEAPWSMRLPLLVLAGLCVGLGVAPQANLALVAPVVGMLAAQSGLAAQALPTLSVSWPPFVLVPMLGAALPFLLRRNPRAAGWSAAGVLLASAAAVALGRGGLDTLSLSFALIVAVMGCLNMVYAVGYMDHSHSQWRFYTFFLFMTGGLLGVAASTDLFSFFTFWEIMSSWTLYFVIVHEESPQALREGYKYFFFNVLGAGFVFLGVLLAVQAAGDPSFEAVRRALGTMPPGTAAAVVGLMALGFAMKAAQLPLRIDVQMHPATAPTPVSGYISSVLLKSALFGLLKLFFVLGGLGALAGLWQQGLVMGALAWVGGVTIVLAALLAVLQSDLKLVLIYSTVSQLGYMVLGLALGSSLGVAGGLLHLANHVLFKDLLFLVAGALLLRTHRHSLDELGGIGRRMPATLAVFAVGALCVVGVPPSNGFTSKWIIYQALMERGEVALALMSLIGSVLTLAYFAKYLHMAFLGQPSRELEHVREAPRTMLVPMILLAAGCVVTSVFPGLLLAPVAAVVAQLGLPGLDVAPWGLASGPGAWNATAVSVLAAVAFGLGWGALRLLMRSVRVSAVHTCGEDLRPEDTRMASRGVYGLPGEMLRNLAAVVVPSVKE
ncbi:proton-conducting transporter membrane subunit [Desulfocurvus sp.]|uniref:complex I subunit 5 family protein n=1 Tax=Desulfocurvus sp. TaxID=2871698 RepID=UPI0025B8F28C|nr:proton-conducting transporter membrane subunit [Desulfocurvus sp.]MCK9239995.1 oxidoreductase [Desulfocurvus sp.]